jgi:hypothetical protein
MLNVNVLGAQGQYTVAIAFFSGMYHIINKITKK